MLFIKIFSTTVITLIISLKALFSQMSALNYEISSLVRPNWEYESFWAIPRIGKTKPPTPRIRHQKICKTQSKQKT